MASNNRRVIFNTRERLLSTDFNDATALFHAKSTDEVAAALTGDFYKNSGGAGAQSGIIGGGYVSTDGVSLNASVSPVIGLKYGTGATSLDSPYLKIESAAATTIDLSTFVDGGNPRWVCIEVAPGDTAEVVSTRDVFQPALGTFTPVSVDKIRAPAPVFTVNAGTPAASPALPLGTAGTVPLAYVYIPAAAAVLLTSDVVRCRPLLGNSSSFYEVKGKGGVNVTSAGGTVARLNPVGARFPRAGSDSGLLGTPVVDSNIATNPNFALGESYPAGDAPIYFYLSSAPYPGGYDVDVANVTREFVDLTVAGTPRIPSNPSVSPGVSINGLIVCSTTAPAVTGLSAPSSVGSYPGALQLNDSTWASGTAGSSVYLGSAMALTSVAPAGLTTQQTHGGRVRITELVKSPFGRFQLVNSNVGSGLTASNLRRLDTMGTGAKFPTAGAVLPEAREWDTLVTVSYFSMATGDAVNAYLVSSAYDLGSQGLSSQDKVWQFIDINGDMFNASGHLDTPLTLRTTDSGSFQFEVSGTTTVSAGTLTISLATRGYLDPILSER